MIPLSERICIDLMKAGVGGPDGGHPRCLGSQCVQFEVCEVVINDAIKKLAEK